MKKILILVMPLLGLLLGCQSHEPEPTQGPDQGWISSGGEYLRNVANPWWVRNTKTVGYCIKHDAETFSGSLESVRRVVTAALAYWQHEFNTPRADFGVPIRYNGVEKNTSMVHIAPWMGQINPLGLATQSFHEVDCDSAKLTFVFGNGKLTSGQRRFFSEHPRLFTSAMRRSSDYDPVNLSTKGTIVVLSDRGDDTFVSRMGLSIREPWSHEIVLLNIVAHELGHAFGIKHVGYRFSLMSDQYPEMVLSTGFYFSRPEQAQRVFIPSLFGRFELTDSFGTVSEKGYDFLEVPAERRGVGYYVVYRLRHDVPVEIPVLSNSNEMRGGSSEVGKITQIAFEEPEYIPIVSLDLPEEQKVFTEAELGWKLDSLQGAYLLQSIEGNGIYRTKSRREKPVHITLSGARLQVLNVSGIIDNRLAPVLSFPRSFYW